MSDPKIRIRRSSTPNKVPTTTQLELGELAINTYDGKLYLEQDQGAAGVGNTVVRVNPWNVGLGTTAYNISFTSGKVGIGTTVAQYNLDVGGNINFTGNLTQDGAAFTSGVTVKDEGSSLSTQATTLNFVGDGVAATGTGAEKTITVTAGSGPTGPTGAQGAAGNTGAQGASGTGAQGAQGYQGASGPTGAQGSTGATGAQGAAGGGGGGSGPTGAQGAQGAQGASGGGGGGASVSVSSNPPGSPSGGDLWWDSDVGELYIYYSDTDSNQWVETSGGSETVTVSDNAPSSPNAGDLWWESDTGQLKIYYNDGDSAQWIDANAGVLSSLTVWQTNSTGINTTSNVGIGTTTATAALTIGVGGTITVGTGVTFESTGQGSFTGIVTASSFRDPYGNVLGATGPTGPTGAQGATGSTGAQGATAAQGAQGATGATGPTGAQGATGSTGAQGATGSGGSTGAQGATGSGGSTGAQGAAGAQGATGSGGSTGAQGATGSTGAQGSGTGTADRITEGNSYAEILDTGTNGIFRFLPEGSEVMRIATDGKMGLGTNNPSQKLHLSASSGDVYNRVDTNVNGGLLIYVQGNQRSVFANDSAFSGTTTDTGIGALGNMIFRTGTSSYNERLRIKSDGKIQLSSATDNIIHTSSNSSRLRLFGGSNETVSNGAVLTLHGVSHSAGNYADLAAGSGGHIRFRVGTSEKLRIDSNGQLLIGTSTSSAYGNRQLAVGDTTDSSSFIEIRTSSTGVGHLLFARTAEGNSGNYHGYIAYAQNTSAMTFHTNAGNERVRITSGGQLYVNTSATDTMFGVKNSGTFELITCRDTSNSLKFYVHHSGATYNSGGSYGSISDVSLKENIVDANSQWDDIKNIKVRNFNFKESTGQETYTQIGVIAQEIETVSPKLVSTPKDDIKTVKYSILYMKAVKALQEAMIRIEALEAKVSALEGS